ncbi:hypothetical protein GCM10028857_03780 [Salinarchaeum chitinilyticum]
MDEGSPDASALSAGSSGLLVASDESACRQALLDALGQVGPETGVLLLATRDAEAFVGDLRRAGVAPEAIGVVDATGGESLPTGVSEADVVPGPGSLSALGVATSDLVERLSYRYDRVVVGVDSTTPLLAATTLPATFRFLHVLGGRVRASEGALLATFDRSAQDEETRRTITQLFDEAVIVE